MTGEHPVPSNTQPQDTGNITGALPNLNQKAHSPRARFFVCIS